VKINRKVLLEKLESVGPGLSAKAVVEQSDHFVFAEGNVATFDGEVACFAPIDLGFSGAVPAKPLLDLLRRLSEDELDLSADGGELLVKGDRKRSGIRIEVKIVLPVEGVEEPKEWRPLDKEFLEAVALVGRCASTDASQFVVTCVHLTPHYIEASDRFQIGRRLVATGVETPCLVRRSSLDSLAKSGVEQVSETDEWLHFRAKSGLRVSLRKYEDKFPLLDKHLDVEGHEVKLPKGEGLEEAVARASVFSAEESTNLMVVELRSGKIKITGRGQHGWHSEVKDVEYAGDDLSFTVAPSVLLEIFRKADKVVVSSGDRCRLAVDAGKFRFVACTGKPRE
jgi:DNA polymerase III sliding clamp (beta) subunit (PCNA family)